MPLQKSPLDLLADFPPSSYQEWRSAAERLLKGAPFDEKLTTPLTEGFTLQPMYMPGLEGAATHPADMYPGFGSLRRGSNPEGIPGGNLAVAQEFAQSSPRELNAVLRSEIDRGLDLIHIVTDVPTRLGHSAARGNLKDRGVRIHSLQDLGALFEGVDILSLPLLLHSGVSVLPLLASLSAHLSRRGETLSSLHGSVIADPLGTLVQTGSLPVSIDSLYDDMCLSVRWADEAASPIRVIGVDGGCYHNGGALSVEELGFSLATGAAYLRELTRRGCTPDQVGKRFLFSFSLGPNFFLEVAKLRAARVLWSTIVAAFGGGAEAQRMHVHGRSSSFFATQLDPTVNMLRGTTEALSGVLGGCDSFHVAPFDECSQQPEEFSRRIARNSLRVLKDEVHVDHVIDPAGGSWYVEWLTDAVAEQAWKIFQKVETAGGMTNALAEGIPQEMVVRSLARRMDDVACKRLRVVGVNVYPNPKEAAPRVPADVSGQGGISPAQAPASEPTRVFLDIETLRKQGPSGLIAGLASAASAGADIGVLFRSLHSLSETPITIRSIAPHRLVEDAEKARAAEQTLKSEGEARR
jgi:methylmalonyl-CoA mutase